MAQSFWGIAQAELKIKLTSASGGKMVLPQVYVQLIGAQWEQAVSSLAWGGGNRSNTSGRSSGRACEGSGQQKWPLEVNPCPLCWDSSGVSSREQ